MTTRRVHLWPRPDASVPGVPHAELLVEPEVAAWILEHQPPAFDRSKPEGWEDGEVLEWEPPDAPKPEPTEEPPEPAEESA